MPKNDQKSLETCNLFEYLHNEETHEEKEDTNFSSNKENSKRREQIKGDNKSQKKKRNEIQKKTKKRKDEKVQDESVFKRNETINSIVVKRCQGCHFEHFPLPKFCRWWEERKATKKEPRKETRQLSIEESLSVKKYIQYLEEKFDEIPKTPKEEIIVNDFFKRSSQSCNAEEIHDIFNLKLRGGGNKKNKVAIKSNNDTIDCVLSFFRDMVPLWQEMDFHPLCDHKSNPKCFYCLLRSLSLRSMNPQVRTPISAVEVLSFFEERNTDKLSIHEMIKSIMDLLSTSEENVSNMFKNISIYCKKCGKDIPIQKHEILDLHVHEGADNLQEILDKHLQNEIDDHFTTYHEYDPKHMKIGINGIKTSKEQTFSFLALDKNMKIDLEGMCGVPTSQFALFPCGVPPKKK